MRSMIHHPAPPPSPSLFDVLGDWVDAGIIPHERRAALALAPSPETGPSLVVEALGYLGGVAMLVGAGILIGMFWADLSVVLDSP